MEEMDELIPSDAPIHRSSRIIASAYVICILLQIFEFANKVCVCAQATKRDNQSKYTDSPNKPIKPFLKKLMFYKYISPEFV
jgi:hypothetical protein